MGIELQQVGTATDIKGNKAIVMLRRATACGESCGSCGGCETTIRKVEAGNSVGAQVGQNVLMEMDDSRILIAAFLVYMVPIIMLFVGYVVGFSIFSKQGAGAASAIVFMLISFVIVKLIDRRLKDSSNYQLNISKIIS